MSTGGVRKLVTRITEGSSLTPVAGQAWPVTILDTWSLLVIGFLWPSKTGMPKNVLPEPDLFEG